MSVDGDAALKGRRVCILGDMRELGAEATELHRKTGELALSKNALLLTTGELSARMGGTHFNTKADLIDVLPELLQPGDIILRKASHSMACEEI